MDICEQETPTRLLNASIFGLACFTIFLRSQPNAILVGTTSPDQNRKAQIRKKRIQDPLKEWQNDANNFSTVHIDYKGSVHPPSNRNLHCLLVIVAFSRFPMFCPVTNTGAQVRIGAVQNGYTLLGYPILLNTIGAPPSLIPISLIEQKILEILTTTNNFFPMYK